MTVQGAGMLDSAVGTSRVFKALAEARVNILLISQASSEHSICLAIKTQESYLAKEAVEKEFFYEIKSGEMDEVVLLHDLATVAVVGENMKHNPGASGRMCFG
mgnify:FL=1